MTRQIDTENNIEIVDETTNNSFPVPPVTGNITGAGFAKTVNLAITEIDGKLGAVTTDLSTEISNAITPVSNKADQNESDITDLDSRVTTAEGDITTSQGDITSLENTKTSLRTLPTTANITYNLNGDITSYQDSLYSANNFVYDVDGDLQSLEETINGITYLVSLIYNGNKDLISVTSVQQ